MRLQLNKVILAGNLARQPELNAVGQTSVCNCALAMNRRYKSGDETKEETCFIDLAAWGNNAERLAKCNIGDNVYIEGELREDQWEKDGDKRRKHKVNVFVVRNLSAQPVQDEEPQPARKNPFRSGVA